MLRFRLLMIAAGYEDGNDVSVVKSFETALRAV
jgi:hypothetical protein